MKICSTCKREKDYEDFYKDKATKDGYNYVCKQCCLERDRRKRKNDPEWHEYRLSQHRKYHAKHRESILERHKIARKTEKGKKQAILNTQKYRKKYPEKKKALDAVYRAVKRGELIKPNRCQRCDVECKCQAHHESYDENKRVFVAWLCPQCHSMLHNKKPCKNSHIKEEI